MDLKNREILGVLGQMEGMEIILSGLYCRVVSHGSAGNARGMRQAARVAAKSAGSPDAAEA